MPVTDLKFCQKSAYTPPPDHAKKVALAMPGIGGLLYRKMRNAGKIMLGDSETVIRNGNWHGNEIPAGGWFWI
jgi:hypothetical protein